MQLVDTPTARPWIAVDGTQGPTSAGPLVDTGINHPIFGRLYLPARVVLEAAGLFGMVAGDVHAAVSSALDKASASLAEAEGELAELRPVRNALDGAARRFAELSAEDEPVRPTARKPRAAAA